MLSPSERVVSDTVFGGQISDRQCHCHGRAAPTRKLQGLCWMIDALRFEAFAMLENGIFPVESTQAELALYVRYT